MQIDVVHDTVCPWCRIGKRYLDRALTQWDGPVTVRWHPYFLDDALPTDRRIDFRERLGARYGLTDVTPMFARVSQAGADADLVFQFERIRHATPTLDSHRLITLTPDERQSDLIDALHTAYFEDGRDIADIATLAELGAGVGLDREAVMAALAGDAARTEVLAAAAHAGASGITGVPFVILGGAVALAGATPTADVLAALREAAGRTLAAS